MKSIILGIFSIGFGIAGNFVIGVEFTTASVIFGLMGGALIALGLDERKHR